MKINGYMGIGPESGIYIEKDQAFKYALERIVADPSLMEEVEAWFYSGNFIYIEREDQTC